MQKHIVNWAEIPVSNMQRAITFYQEVLQVSIKQDKMGDYDYSVFEADEEAVSCALVAGEGYKPGIEGSVIYLNGGEDLTRPLEIATKLGSEVLIPKTAINDGDCGYFAQFVDSEGNRIGLYSKS